MKKYILFLLAVFLLGSCKIMFNKIFLVPEFEFYLNEKDENNAIYCKKLSHFDLVKRTGYNALEILPGGSVAMCVGSLTQLHADFTVEIFEGDGLNFAFRTGRYQFENHPKIIFEYTTSGCIIKENETILAKVDSIKARLNEKFRVQIDNNGSLYNIVVDCDTVYKGRTDIPASEFVVVQSLYSSSAQLSGIEFDAYVETRKYMKKEEE